MADNGTSRSFFDGNYGDNYNPFTKGFYDRDRQTQEAIELSNQSTLKKYQDLYHKLGEEHQTYLAGVSRRESATYKTVCATILTGYKDMYESLISSHKKYIDTVNAFSIEPVSFDFDVNTTVDTYMDFYSQLETLHDIYLADVEKKETEAYQRVLDANLKNYNETVAKMQKTIGGTEGESTANMGVASSIVALTALIEKSFSDNFKEDLFKFINEHPVGTGEGTGGGKRPSRVIDDKKPKVDKSTLRMADRIDKISDRTVDLLRSVSDTVVIGKENQIWAKTFTEGITKTTDVVTAFMAQEKMAESLVQLIFWGINKILDYFGASIQEQQNAYEEVYTKFAVYADHSDKNWNLQDKYWSDVDGTLSELYNLGLENNIKSSEVTKKQVELLSKGMDADKANAYALQDILIGTIAPALNTESEVIKDLQQTSKFDTLQKLAGITEYVREITGSSRVTMGSLGTVIDKLVPIEMMSKKSMLSGKELALAEYLDKEGVMTYQQATSLLVDAVDVVADPFKAVTSGNLLQKMAVASGNYSDSYEVMKSFIENSTNILGDLNEDSLVSSALLNSTGTTGYYNWGSNPEEIAGTIENFEDTFTDEMAERSPAQSFQDLYDLLKDDKLQTADKIQEVRRVNAKYGADIAERMQSLYEELASIGETAMDIADFLLVGENYKQKRAQQKLDNLPTTAYGTDEAKEILEDYKGTLKDEAWGNAIHHGFTDVGLGYVYNSWKGLFTDKDGVSSGEGSKSDLAKVVTHNVVSGVKDSIKSGNLGWDILNFLTAGTVDAYRNAKSDIDSSVSTYKSYAGKMGNVQNAYTPEYMGYASGGYVTKPQVVVVAEHEPEIITPEKKMSDVVTSSLNTVFSKPLTIDASSLEDIIQSCTERVITAILSSGNQTIVDPTTGLMKQGNTNTKPITSLGSFMR